MWCPMCGCEAHEIKRVGTLFASCGSQPSKKVKMLI
jgi:hypothetical protein